MQQNTPFYSNYLIQNTKGSNFIMKTMKKIFALTLALMLVFSLALTANADNLTVEGALKGAEYEIYKIATVNEEESGALVYTADASWVNFLKDLPWINFFEGETSMKFVRKGNPTEADMIAAAKAAKAYAATNSIAATQANTATGDTPAASFSNVADGYYLMTSDKGSLCTLATITSEDTTIKEKNETLPQIDKTVENAKNANAAIGDTVEFTLTVTTGENHENEMQYVIHDTMSDGLTLNQGSIVVKYKDSADATEEKTLSLTTDYTVHAPGTETEEAKKCTFEIKFTNTLTTKANGIMTVTYTATVNEGATDEETNKAKIDLDESEVTVTTTQFSLNKVDGDNQALSGAKFKLYVADTTSANSYKEIPVVKNADGTYRPAVGNETGVEIEAGTATVKGLDSDVTYYVKETEAPTGYVKIDDYKVVENGTVTVTNVKGEELPETGGMGTTLFYTLGGMMVAAAAVLLVTKKRMRSM